MLNRYVEIIGPTGSGKTCHLMALNEDPHFSIKTRHRARQHVLMLVKSALIWMYLQFRFLFLDNRLILFKRLCVYFAALKTSESEEKKKKRASCKQGENFVDEGVLHVLLMHRFASLKERSAWAFFAESQLCKLVKHKEVIVFALSVNDGLRYKRLKRRNLIESERLRLDNKHKALPFEPLGIEFIDFLNCNGTGQFKVFMLDNNGVNSVKSNVERVKSILLSQ